MKTFVTAHIKIDQGNCYVGLWKNFIFFRKDSVCKCNPVDVLEMRASWITQMGSWIQWWMSVRDRRRGTQWERPCANRARDRCDTDIENTWVTRNKKDKGGSSPDRAGHVSLDLGLLTSRAVKGQSPVLRVLGNTVWQPKVAPKERQLATQTCFCLGQG